MSANGVNPRVAHLVERLQPSPGNGQHVPDRDPHAPPVERIGTLRVEQHRVDPERRRAPEHAAEILVVAELLHAPRPAGPPSSTAATGGERPAIARRDRTPVQIEPDHRAAARPGGAT